MKEELTKQEKLFLQNTRKRVGKAIHKYELLKENDAVLIAVSGGKDSMFLLESLALAKKHIPFNFTLKAVHIKVIDAEYEIDNKYLENLCNELEVPLTYYEIAIGNLTESKKSPCFICSWKRRHALFEAVEKLNCNKLALGHHMDDAIETLLLNMTYHGNISSMPPELQMFKGKFKIIRPLLMVEEQNISKYVNIRQFPDEIALCPFEEKGNRYEMKKVVEHLAQLNKTARINLFRSMTKIDYEYLPQVR